MSDVFVSCAVRVMKGTENMCLLKHLYVYVYLCHIETIELLPLFRDELCQFKTWCEVTLQLVIVWCKDRKEQPEKRSASVIFFSKTGSFDKYILINFVKFNINHSSTKIWFNIIRFLPVNESTYCIPRVVSMTLHYCVLIANVLNCWIKSYFN